LRAIFQIFVLPNDTRYCRFFAGMEGVGADDRSMRVGIVTIRHRHRVSSTSRDI
jgi:hypothetical protein